ncbi:unnamed protein product [Protopolystoma xenopodis]|uniref:Uncharacterized protein n=1 Tax=Protopolystoma xenopodis TaxID=117903 RepID=A0A3S5CEV8_9PLAT|nr:unnamed protein product [Protopolystoma xenopodis]
MMRERLEMQINFTLPYLLNGILIQIGLLFASLLRPISIHNGTLNHVEYQQVTTTRLPIGHIAEVTTILSEEILKSAPPEDDGRFLLTSC